MKVLTQNFRTGNLDFIEVPKPVVKSKFILVRNVASLVSIGTEKAMVELARKSLIGKAIARPDWVAQTTDKIRSEGLVEAYRQSEGRLSRPIPLGYSSSGVVEEVGPGVDRFVAGDHVACTGSGYASHAEYVLVPSQLSARKPEKTDFEEASFVTLGGIALEAIRLAKPEIGQRIAVIGLGLLGLLTVQILKASGCKVLGIDVAQNKLRLGEDFGCDIVAHANSADVESIADSFTRGNGVDSVIILAATESDQPLRQAAAICMERGIIVAGGLIGLNVPRPIFFEKELKLAVPKAHGPGVDDPNFIRHGEHYPLSQFRWNATQNVETFFDLLDEGKVNVKSLISHRFSFDEAKQAYQQVLNGGEENIGVVLNYEHRYSDELPIIIPISSRTRKTRNDDELSIGVIGAGQYARGTFLPILSRVKGTRLRWIVAANGINADSVGKKYGFESFSSGTDELLKDEETDVVIVLTRHGSHARIVSDSFRLGKHVFVEKPLALNRPQLDEVLEAYSEGGMPLLAVGYNRRFAPTSMWLKDKFGSITEPIGLNFRINAGMIPRNSWVYDEEEGGGRIVGEICHFIDLVQFFSNSLIVEVFCKSLGSDRYHTTDNLAITLKTENGSISSISYFAGGDKSYPRERFEIFGGGSSGSIREFSDRYIYVIWPNGKIW